MNIYDSRTTPMWNVDWFGVAIRRNRNNSTHIGIIYRLDESQTCFLLHLGTDCELRRDIANEFAGYYWLNVQFSFEEKIFLAAWAEMIFTNNGSQITYGFDTSGKFFDLSTGHFIPGRTGPGLTCATFVLELIESKFKFLEKSSWPKAGKSDISWRKTMLAQLRINGVPQAIIDYQMKKIGNRRFLPEHVAAATQSYDRPCFYLKIKNVAKEILNKIPKSLEA